MQDYWQHAGQHFTSASSQLPSDSMWMLLPSLPIDLAHSRITKMLQQARPSSASGEAGQQEEQLITAWLDERPVRLAQTLHRGPRWCALTHLWPERQCSPRPCRQTDWLRR